MRMLSPDLDEGVVPGETGVHFGIVTRQREEAAWEAAERVFRKTSAASASRR